MRQVIHNNAMSFSKKRFFHVFDCIVSYGVAMGALAAAATVPACVRECPEASLPAPAPADSVLVCLNFPGSTAVRTVDVLIWRDTLDRSLSGHVRTGPAGALKLPRPKGGCIVAAIANNPYELNTDALARYESAELLIMMYRDEDPVFPLLSSVSRAEDDTLSLFLQPLLCPVKVLSISNHTGKLLRSPSVCLTGVNASAEMLRSSGFRPSYMVDSPAETAHPEMMLARLSEDIGERTVFPDLTLFAYPNDAPDGPGAMRTELMLSATVDGSPYTYSTPLPAFGRGSTVNVALTLPDASRQPPGQYSQTGDT